MCTHARSLWRLEPLRIRWEGLGLGLRAPGGPGRGDRVLKEDLRKKLEDFEGKSGEPQKVMKVFRVPESWRKRT